MEFVSSNEQEPGSARCYNGAQLKGDESRPGIDVTAVSNFIQALLYPQPLPSYDGTTPPHIFLEDLEDYFLLQQTSDTQKFQMLVACLSADAADWFDLFGRDLITTVPLDQRYAVLKTQLIEIFEAKMPRLEWEMELFSEYQIPGDPLAPFILRKLNLIRQLNWKFTEAEKMDLIVPRLLPDIQDLLDCAHLSSTKQLFTFALRYDQRRKSFSTQEDTTPTTSYDSEYCIPVHSPAATFSTDEPACTFSCGSLKCCSQPTSHLEFYSSPDFASSLSVSDSSDPFHASTSEQDVISGPPVPVPTPVPDLPEANAQKLCLQQERETCSFTPPEPVSGATDAIINDLQSPLAMSLSSSKGTTIPDKSMCSHQHQTSRRPRQTNRKTSQHRSIQLHAAHISASVVKPLTSHRVQKNYFHVRTNSHIPQTRKSISSNVRAITVRSTGKAPKRTESSFPVPNTNPVWVPSTRPKCRADSRPPRKTSKFTRMKQKQLRKAALHLWLKELSFPPLEQFSAVKLRPNG